MTNRHTVSRTRTRKNEETGTLRNEINCVGIGTLKCHIVQVISKRPPILTRYDEII